MTVFLTTQYLEEADQLAERVGIIDHGRIVAEGTPTALKAEVGRPTVEAVPADTAQRESAAAVLDRFGELIPGTPNGAAVRLDNGPETLAAIVRAFDEEGHRRSPISTCTPRASTTSSSPRPAARSRAPVPRRPRPPSPARSRRWSARRRERRRRPARVPLAARRACR